MSQLVGLLVALGASLGASWDLLGLLGRRLVALGASLGPCLGSSCWLLGASRWLLALLEKQRFIANGIIAAVLKLD